MTLDKEAMFESFVYHIFFLLVPILFFEQGHMLICFV